MWEESRLQARRRSRSAKSAPPSPCWHSCTPKDTKPSLQQPQEAECVARQRENFQSEPWATSSCPSFSLSEKNRVHRTFFSRLLARPFPGIISPHFAISEVGYVSHLYGLPTRSKGQLPTQSLPPTFQTPLEHQLAEKTRDAQGKTGSRIYLHSLPRQRQSGYRLIPV